MAHLECLKACACGDDSAVKLKGPVARWPLNAFSNEEIQMRRGTVVSMAIVLVLACGWAAVCVGQEANSATGNPYMVSWDSPSEDSWGSMPLGNGDIGLNVWVEADGQLHFYVAKTDAWSENCRLLKLGRIRVSLTPNPFTGGQPFRQVLDVKKGEIRIEAGGAESRVSLKVWVDAHHPVIHLDGSAAGGAKVQVDLESWRTSRRALEEPETFSAYGVVKGPKPVVVEPDILISDYADGLMWCHRNERSIWRGNMELVGLGHLVGRLTDPLLNRTFGAVVKGANLAKVTDTRLQSKGSTKAISVAVYPLTAQAATLEEWKASLNREVRRLEGLDKGECVRGHTQWWQDFWDRHYINISGNDAAFTVTRGYVLQRFINACAGRGRYPIKFNGSLFNVDMAKSVRNVPAGYDADFRAWGGCYWFQNTRLPYWSMLYSGDFEMMRPWFKMYMDALPVSEAMTEAYYGHGGAFFPETMYFWGTYNNDNYGWDRSGLEDGYTANKYVRYYWQCGLELSLIMLDYYGFTGDAVFAERTLVPFVSGILTFFDQHWGRDANGKIRFEPAMSLETYGVAVNPLPEIVGIEKVASGMLSLPEALTTAQQRGDWSRLRGELPGVPMREVSSGQVLSPAESYSKLQNSENPELYAVFPYRTYGVGKAGLELAQRTFRARRIKDTRGWRQDAIQAALVGLTDEAQRCVVSNFSTKHAGSRFPAFWGPNFDWIPDQDHGGVAMVALQRMLIQAEGQEVRLLPAWPTEWDVEFKLHAPGKTVVAGVVREGRLEQLKVTPGVRRDDIKVSEDFAQSAECYCNAELPALMEFLDGRAVETKADLERRRQEIRDLWCEYFIGSFPAEVPAVLEAEILEEKKAADGSTRRRVKLTLETPNKASFEMWVWIPESEGPYPLLLTQPRDYQLAWAEEAVRRGYVACLYPGVNMNRSEPDYPGYERVWRTFKAEYPQASWASSLGIQAWLASRALDYLLDPQYHYNIASGKVGIIGHSRYGKQSLYAAAFDERITAVIARSSGSPTACSYRFASRQTFMESVVDGLDHWALGSLKGFLGREHELPMEGHGLLALIAPRFCMLHTAHNDSCDPTFGVERGYLEGRKVYEFLGHPERLRNVYRKGNHNPVTAEHVKQNLDWFDYAFGRGRATVKDFPEVLLHHFDWQGWRGSQSAEDMKAPGAGASVKERIGWMLGRVPDHVVGEGEYHIRSGEELGVPDKQRDWLKPGGMGRMACSFGGKIHGNLYFDPKAAGPRPVVVWLHPWNYSLGVSEGYGPIGAGYSYPPTCWRLAQEGYVVLAYDQVGFGDRLLEGPDFYETYPHWSRMGRAVYDVSRAVDFLREGKGIVRGQMPAIDKDRICVLGYGFGSMVGLYAAALDDRISSVACFCGLAPLRTNTHERVTGGNRRLWEWHALVPKLGLFDGRESEIPYDYGEVLGLVAPRPCLVYSPQRDRFADVDEVSRCVGEAAKQWPSSTGASTALRHERPDDMNRFQKAQQDIFIEWLKGLGY